MILLRTDRLVLRTWEDTDRDLFREINRDHKVMEYFPFRRTHEEADAMLERLRADMADTGLGFHALELVETGEPIGFCGLAHARLEPLLPDQAVEIGWRLATRFWGNGYVTEAATALCRHGFETLALNEILSFAVAGNARSIRVMRRIGMKPAPELDFDHPRVPDTHPHLKRHVVYRMTREHARMLPRAQDTPPRP